MTHVAVITGVKNSIGRAVCRRLAASGILIAIVDYDGKEAECIQADLINTGGKVENYCIDITSERQVRETVAALVGRHSRIDILVNIVAGNIRSKCIEELTWAEWKEDFEMILKGTFLFCREVGAVMVNQKQGRIVNTTPSNAVTDLRVPTSYSAATAGLIGFSKSLALEMAPYGVLVNVIAPGPIDIPIISPSSTPRDKTWVQEIPIGRTAQPEEIAEAVYFLIGTESAYMTGQTLHVNGGLVMP